MQTWPASGHHCDIHWNLTIIIQIQLKVAAFLSRNIKTSRKDRELQPYTISYIHSYIRMPVATSDRKADWFNTRAQLSETRTHRRI